MPKDVLTKADIVEAVQSKVGLSKQITAQIVTDLLEIIKDSLQNGENVKISGFGNFEVRQKQARRGRNPQTGDPIIIPARRVLTFKPSQVLRRAVRDDT